MDVGYSRVESSAQETANVLVNILGGAVTVLQNTGVPVGRLFAGYAINQTYALELGYLRTGDVTQNIAGVSGGLVPYTGNANASVSGLEFSALIRPVITNGWERFFIRAGGHNFDISTNVTLTGIGTASAKTSISGSGLLIGIGYDTPISHSLSSRSAYTHYDKIGGDSSSYANIFTVGLVAKF